MAIHISRRDFIVTLGSAAAAWPLAARGQQSERVRRIGYLSPAKAAPIDAVFIEALRQLGWIEGNNASLEIRYAENDAARLARMADELVRLNVDVIVARGTLGPLAAKRATKTIPIVMASSGDPLGSGLVASLARPGGNVTGMSLMAPDLGGKRLEILKDMLPALSRVAILWNAAIRTPLSFFGRPRAPPESWVSRFSQLNCAASAILTGRLGMRCGTILVL